MPIKHEQRKEYMAAYIRKHYADNKEKYLKSVAARKKRLRELIRLNKQVPCVDCKVQYPYYVMDFDHQYDKAFNIAAMVTKGFGEKKILDEIAKCDVVCSNCHRIRTHGSLA